MKLEEMFLRCDRCQGKGRVVETPPRTNTYGTNCVMSEGPCPDCGGQGGRITETGQAIAEFLSILKQRGRI